MFNGIFRVPQPINEPCLSYGPGTPERDAIRAELKTMLGETYDIPMIIDGQEVRNGKLASMVCPHDHKHELGKYHQANPMYVTQAVDAAQKAKQTWGNMPWESRAAILLKAAELLSGKYRMTLNAATMLNTSKTPHQAEIDSACELIDFWRFNPHFMEEVYSDQPQSTKGILNYMEHRPLDGFVLAITPINIASIAGNLPTAPALMGNTVVWKPASAPLFMIFSSRNRFSSLSRRRVRDFKIASGDEARRLCNMVNAKPTVPFLPSFSRASARLNSSRT